MLEPVGATVLGWSWYNQTLTVAQVVGVVAILGGIALAQTARMTKRQAKPAIG